MGNVELMCEFTFRAMLAEWWGCFAFLALSRATECSRRGCGAGQSVIHHMFPGRAHIARFALTRGDGNGKSVRG